MAQDWKSAISAALGKDIQQLQQLGGGDFAAAYRVIFDDNSRLFVKTHSNPPAHFFSTEATGLQWLNAVLAHRIPAVTGFSDTPPYLALQWIEIGGRSSGVDEAAFGRDLALLHKASDPAATPVFGRPDKRTTGSLGVPNNPCPDWATFYASQRLIPLIEIASQRRSLPDRTLKNLTSIAESLRELGCDPEPPSLLHGDLWAGNRVVDSAGHSWLIDPACHYGHREFDLAMMRLFGGYDQACFDAYQESYPLQPDWQQRIALHQLAPLIVHAIKFGGSYVSSTAAAAARYV